MFFFYLQMEKKDIGEAVPIQFPEGKMKKGIKVAPCVQGRVTLNV